MKKILIAVALFLGTNCSAQLGAITTKLKDRIYYSQWYTIQGKDFKHCLFYYDTDERIDEVLYGLLKTYEYDYLEAEKDENGSLVWTIDTGNEFTATVIRIDSDLPDEAFIKIKVVANN
jgi:hypothetical protein